MNPRTLILALVALSLAGGTALFARHWLDTQRAVAVAVVPLKQEAPAKEVLVAAKPLPAGSFVKPDQLRWQPWPEDGVADSYAVKGKADMKAYVGSVVRHDVAPGEPITSARLVKPGDRGFLAAVLMPGMRAVSVTVTAETGISGLVFPGDRVDLILAQGFRSANSESAPMRRASETVLTDLRVLAIDQRTAEGDAKPTIGKTVTLEVTPKQAELVAVAMELGKLSLSLRSLATEDPVVASRGRGLTWDSEVSRAVGRSIGGSSNEVQVVRGSKAEKVQTKEAAPSKTADPAGSSKPAPSTAGTPLSDASGASAHLMNVAKGSQSEAAQISQVLR